jgi:hypothetical protein
MPTPSKRHLNWPTVTFTPAGGSLGAITGVQDFEIAPGGNLIKHSGDGDRAPTTVVNDYNDPTVTVTHRDLTAQHALVPGVRGVLVGTHADAKNGVVVGGGGYTVTLTNAVIGDNPSGGRHRQFGEARTMFSAESADGTTSALAYAAL